MKGKQKSRHVIRREPRFIPGPVMGHRGPFFDGVVSGSGCERVLVLVDVELPKHNGHCTVLRVAPESSRLRAARSQGDRLRERYVIVRC